MAVLTEGRHAGEFLLSEANGARSRASVTLAAGQGITPGEVLGSVAGVYEALDLAANDGAQHAVGIAFYAAQTGAETEKLVIIARDAEVNQHCLTWPAAITTAQKQAAIVELAALGIILR
jgi:hypothetical protein